MSGTEGAEVLQRGARGPNTIKAVYLGHPYGVVEKTRSIMMPVAVAFIVDDTVVREIHNMNADGYGFKDPKYGMGPTTGPNTPRTPFKFNNFGRVYPIKAEWIRPSAHFRHLPATDSAYDAEVRRLLALPNGHVLYPACFLNVWPGYDAINVG